MGKKFFGKYLGITLAILFAVAFNPSSLSQAEWTPGNGASLPSVGSAGMIKEGVVVAGTSTGTIAMGTAIAEASAIAIAASQPGLPNSMTVH